MKKILKSKTNLVYSLNIVLNNNIHREILKTSCNLLIKYTVKCLFLKTFKSLMLWRSLGRLLPWFAKLNKRSPKYPPPPQSLSINHPRPLDSPLQPHPNVLELEKLSEGLARVIKLLSRTSDDPRKTSNGSVMINNVMACAVTDITWIIIIMCCVKLPDKRPLKNTELCFSDPTHNMVPGSLKY